MRDREREREREREVWEDYEYLVQWKLGKENITRGKPLPGKWT
jgi:hypothetical protein